MSPYIPIAKVRGFTATLGKKVHPPLFAAETGVRGGFRPHRAPPFLFLCYNLCRFCNRYCFLSMTWAMSRAKSASKQFPYGRKKQDEE